MKKLLVILIVFSLVFYAFPIQQAKASSSSVNTIWEMNASATAGNVNGGGFDPSNANFLTDWDFTSATSTAPVASSSTISLLASDTGWVFVKSGVNVNTGCWYPISSITSGKATLNATAGAGVCQDSTKGSPTPRFTATTSNGISSTTPTTTGATVAYDFSQSTGARVAWASGPPSDGAENFTNDLTCTNVVPSVCSSASRLFRATDVGNFLHVTAGTNATTSIIGGLWGEIVSVAAGAATLDHNITTGAADMTSATARLGGAMSFNSTLDNDFFNDAAGLNGTGGMRYFIKTGSYTLGEALTFATGGSTQAPVTIEGYNTTRGDLSLTPTQANYPSINIANNSFTMATATNLWNIYFYGIGTSVVVTSSQSQMHNLKIRNNSTTVLRNALNLSNSGSYGFNVDAVSIRGFAVSSGVTQFMFDSYLHDSAYGIRISNSAMIMNNMLIANNTIAAINVSTPSSYEYWHNVTFYGSENKTSDGANILTGGTFGNPTVTNSIFYGFNTAATSTDVQTMNFDDYNDYYNNTNDTYRFQKGQHDLALDPVFTNVHQMTGTNASSTTNVLTYTTGGFNAVVTNDVTYVNITAGTGTGLATGSYPIHSHTDTTLTLATEQNSGINVTTAGNGTAISFQLTYGNDWSIGTNLKAQGFPGAYPGSSTTGYMDIGAVQRQEAASGACTSSAVASYVCIGN